MELKDEEIALGIFLSSFWTPLNKDSLLKNTFQDKQLLLAYKARNIGQIQYLKEKTGSFSIKFFEMRNDISFDRMTQFTSFSTELYKWI